MWYLQSRIRSRVLSCSLCFDHTSDLPSSIHKEPHLVKEPWLIRFCAAEVSERARRGVQHMDIDLCAA